jgi:hypothetical protein
MGFLLPTALALAALAVPIIIFYMLKLRRQPAPISSLLLWSQVLADRQANAPWQRLKRNLLLLLQLLILALLVMALARPYFIVQANVRGNVVLLLDASASMQATDVSPSRFAAAQAAALDLIGRLGPEDAVTLITVADPPGILASASTDRSALRQAITAARASNGSADWNAALTLAAANAAILPQATIVIISDGATTLYGEGEEKSSPLPPMPVPVQVIPIGQGANNQGLVALSLRSGRKGLELFVRAASAAPQPTSRLIEVRVDGRLADARQLELPASLTLNDLPLDTHQVEVRLAGSDALPADDIAWAVRSAAPARVLLVGPGNLFLERALAILPGLSLQKAPPDQPLPQTPFDLIIFDRTLPPELPPDTSLFFIAPPASTSLFEVRGVFTQTALTDIKLKADDPLLAYVKLNNLHLARAQAITPPPWATTLVEARGGPLLLAGQSGGRRVAILAFDLHQSDLPLQIDFPILLLNLTRWLLPGEAALSQSQSLVAGDAFHLPTASTAESFLIKTPTGEVTLAAGQPTFKQTDALGLYQVFAQETLLAEFAVNLLSAEETNIGPGRLHVTGAAPEAAIGQQILGQWEWWWILVVAGVGVLLAEWWLYWRGEAR